MLEPGGGQRLAPETGDEVLILGEVLGEQLDRHGALEDRVGGHEDRRHATRAEALLHAIAPGDDLGRAHPPSSGPGGPPAVPVAGTPLGRNRLGRRLLGLRRDLLGLRGDLLGLRRQRLGFGLRRQRIGLGLLALLLVALLGAQLKEMVEAALQGLANVAVHVLGQSADDRSTPGCESLTDVGAGAAAEVEAALNLIKALVELLRRGDRDRLALLLVGAAARGQSGRRQEQRDNGGAKSHWPL